MLLGFPCSNASSGTPWTDVDHPTNLDDGFAAPPHPRSRRSDQRSGSVPAHAAAPFGAAMQSGYGQGRWPSWSDVTPDAVTQDRDHSGRGDQQPEDPLDRGHHAASAPIRLCYEHATPSAHRPVLARPTRESPARLNQHSYRNRQKQPQKRHTRRSSSSGDGPDQEDRGAVAWSAGRKRRGRCATRGRGPRFAWASGEFAASATVATSLQHRRVHARSEIVPTGSLPALRSRRVALRRVGVCP
jgi:hypothetical protein